MDTRTIELTSEERGFIVTALQTAQAVLAGRWKRRSEPPTFEDSFSYTLKASSLNMAIEILIDAEELGDDRSPIPMGILGVIGITLEWYAQDEYDAAAIQWQVNDLRRELVLLPNEETDEDRAEWQQQAEVWRKDGKDRALELARRFMPESV